MGLNTRIAVTVVLSWMVWNWWISSSLPISESFQTEQPPCALTYASPSSPTPHLATCAPPTRLLCPLLISTPSIRSSSSSDTLWLAISITKADTINSNNDSNNDRDNNNDNSEMESLLDALDVAHATCQYIATTYGPTSPLPSTPSTPSLPLHVVAAAQASHVAEMEIDPSGPDLSASSRHDVGLKSLWSSLPPGARVVVSMGSASPGVAARGMVEMRTWLLAKTWWDVVTSVVLAPPRLGWYVFTTGLSFALWVPLQGLSLLLYLLAHVWSIMAGMVMFVLGWLLWFVCQSIYIITCGAILAALIPFVIPYTSQGTAAASSDSSSPPRRECVVCMDAPASAVLAPCGHRVTCLPHARLLLSRSDPCPICRASILCIVERVFD